MTEKLLELRLKNFQCHDSLDIPLDENVTTIVGPSDVGKSAVIRALKWLVTNKPSGDAFRKDGTKSTTVGLKFDDGQVLLRKKSDSTNKYQLNKEDYVSFGNDVPLQITEQLNISHLNWQSQHDAPYWFCETAGQVSRELNAIVNLDVIDLTLKNIASLLRKTKTEKELTETRLKDAQEEVDNLEYVEELNKDYKRLEKREAKVNEKASEASRIASLVEEAFRCQKDSKRLSAAHRDGFKVVETGNEWKESVAALSVLETQLKRVEIAEKEASVELPSEDEIEEVLSAYSEYEDLVNKGKELVAEIQDVERKKSTWLDADQAAIKAKREFKNKTGGVCPICGNEMKEN